MCVGGENYARWHTQWRGNQLVLVERGRAVVGMRDGQNVHAVTMNVALPKKITAGDSCNVIQ